MPDYDCERCGACCVQTGPFDGNSYVYLDRDETRRLRGLGLPIVAQALVARSLAAEPHDGAGGRPACVAFTGALGGRCGCSVYTNRPSVCREFEVGGELCQQERHRAGLSV